MMNLSRTFMLTTLLLTGCASNYNNGVSTWSATHEQPELLETQEYERYTVEEVQAPEYRVVETEILELGDQDLIAVSETTPSMPLAKLNTTPAYDQVTTITSASRPSYSYVNVVDRDLDPSVPDSVVVSPNEVIVRRPVIVSKNVTKRALPSGTYSNKSRGPYHYMYNKPVTTYSQVVTTTSSATRPTTEYTRRYKVELENDGSGCFVSSKGVDRPMLTKVLCTEQLTTDLVSKIQTSLNSKGYSAGPVTGYMGTETLDALYKYQTAKNLTAGAVTIDTLNSLGINSYNF